MRLPPAAAASPAALAEAVARALGVAPETLTHVAIPFPPDDPLYGLVGPTKAAGLLPIGRLSPRGERDVLSVNVDALMRLSSNPFFSFVADRVRAFVADGGS